MDTEAVRTRAAADVEAQVGKSGAARGDQLHEADMEASPIAQLTAVRLADSSAGQRALDGWPQQQSTQVGPTMTSYDGCTAAGRALVP